MLLWYQDNEYNLGDKQVDIAQSKFNLQEKAKGKGEAAKGVAEHDTAQVCNSTTPIQIPHRKRGLKVNATSRSIGLQQTKEVLVLLQ